MVDNNFQGPERYLGLLSKILILFGFFLLGGFIGQFIGLLSVVLIVGFPTQDVNQFQKLVLDFMAHPQNYDGAFRAMMAAYPGLEVIEFLDAPGTSNEI